MSDRKDLEEALGIAPADIDGWWYGGEELGGGLGFKPSLMAVLKAPRISPIFTGLLEVISVRVSRGEPRKRFFSRKKNGAESSNTMQGADMINANAQGRPNLVDLMRESRNSRRRSEPAEATEPGTRAPSRRSSAPTPSVARSSSSSLSRGSSRSSSLAPSVLQSGAPTQEPTTSTSAQPPTPGPNTDLSNLRSRTAPSVQLPALGFGIFYSRVLPFLGPSGQSAFAASGAFHPLVPCKGITSERVAEFTKNSDEAAAAAREEVMLMLPAELVPLEELERSFKWVANETTAARGQRWKDHEESTLNAARVHSLTQLTKRLSVQERTKGFEHLATNLMRKRAEHNTDGSWPFDQNVVGADGSAILEYEPSSRSQPISPKSESHTFFAKKEFASYLNSEGQWVNAQIESVHCDFNLEPFYEILLDGDRVKGTVGGRLKKRLDTPIKLPPVLEDDQLSEQDISDSSDEEDADAVRRYQSVASVPMNEDDADAGADSSALWPCGTPIEVFVHDSYRFKWIAATAEGINSSGLSVLHFDGERDTVPHGKIGEYIRSPQAAWSPEPLPPDSIDEDDILESSDEEDAGAAQRYRDAASLPVDEEAAEGARLASEGARLYSGAASEEGNRRFVLVTAGDDISFKVNDDVDYLNSKGKWRRATVTGVAFKDPKTLKPFYLVRTAGSGKDRAADEFCLRDHIVAAAAQTSSTAASHASPGADQKRYVVRAKECETFTAHCKRRGGFDLCGPCSEILNSVNNKVNRELAKRRSIPSIFEPHSSVAGSPTRSAQALARSAKIIKVEKQRVRRLAAELHLDANGMDLQPGPELDVLNETILDADVAAQQHFSAKARAEVQQEAASLGFDDVELERMIWDEAVANARRAGTSGTKRVCRYSPITIKFAICMRAKCGVAVYDNLRKVFSLPTDRRLQDFRGSSSEDKDGMMYGIIAGMAKLADDEGFSDWKRKGAVCFDSMKLRQGLYWSINSERITGFGSEIYDAPDIIASEFASQARKASSASAAGAKLPLAKDYLVFYFTSLDPQANFRFPVARYCLSSITPTFLVSTINYVLAELDNYGFVGVSVTSDGAGENRATTAALAKIPASFFLETMEGKKVDLVDSEGSSVEATIVEDRGGGLVQVRLTPTGELLEVDLEDVDHVFLDLPKQVESLPLPPGAVLKSYQYLKQFWHKKALPAGILLDKLIAFKHPTRPGVYVFINQDMPHVIKRAVNALEKSNPDNSNKRGMCKFDARGFPESLCLDMVKKAWTGLGGGDLSVIRIDSAMKLTKGHFEKDCFTRMRVALAFQVVSSRAAKLMEEAVESLSEEELPGKKKYSSLIDLCRKLDRLQDIFNARSERRAPIINSPQSSLLDEVVDILGWFASWRLDLISRGADLDVSFFPPELWDDLNGLCLGLACTSRFYLASNPNCALVQRFFDQDPCEHHFNHARLNMSGGAPDARSATSSGGTGGSVRMAGGTGNSGTARMGSTDVKRGLLDLRRAQATGHGDGKYFFPKRGI